MTNLHGTGRYVLWQAGLNDGYRYSNRRDAARAARESAKTTGDAWVTDGEGSRAPQIDRYRRGERGNVYRANPAVR